LAWIGLYRHCIHAASTAACLQVFAGSKRQFPDCDAVICDRNFLQIDDQRTPKNDKASQIEVQLPTSIADHDQCSGLPSMQKSGH